MFKSIHRLRFTLVSLGIKNDSPLKPQEIMMLSHYHLDQVANAVFDIVASEPQEQLLGLNDVFSILEYQKDYFDQMSFSGRAGSRTQIMQFIRINANLEGKHYSDRQIREVLKAEEVFLRELMDTDEFDALD